MAFIFVEPKKPEVPQYLIPPDNLNPVPDLRGKDLTFELVTEFVKERNRASCFEMMQAFGIPYHRAVQLMDGLEEREVVPKLPTFPVYAGPRSVKLSPKT